MAKVLPFQTKEERQAAQNADDVTEMVKSLKAMFTKEEAERIALDLNDGEDDE